jgi:tetratricopeptide (TPR) repeat protein
MQDFRFKGLTQCSLPVGSEWLTAHRQGEASMQAGDLSTARVHLLNALSISQHMQKTDPRVLITLNKLGELSERLLEYEDAVSFVKRSIEIETSIFGANSKPILDRVQKLVTLYSLLGLWNEARQSAAQSIRLQTKLDIEISQNEEVRDLEQQATTMTHTPELPVEFFEKPKAVKIQGRSISAEIRRCVRKAMKVTFFADEKGA